MNQADRKQSGWERLGRKLKALSNFALLSPRVNLMIPAGRLVEGDYLTILTLSVHPAM